MKKYKCPRCNNTKSVIRYGYRGKVIRLFCNRCDKSFSFNPCFLDKKLVLSDHLDGLSFRALANKHKISHMKAWRICEEELRRLPNNNQFTFNYCNRFSQIFLFDGKYFNVATDKYDWVLLWGVDYLRHDIPVFTIAPSENYQSWRTFFSYLRILTVYPRLLVCDDNVNLKMAARDAFPAVKIQTCYNHFKENIRRDLHIRSDKTNQYRNFMDRIESVLNSSNKLSDETFNRWLFCLYRDYKHDPIALNVLVNIEKYKPELLAYRNVPQAPLTTNLIEGLNGHLEGRLQKLRSFQTPEYAHLWFNGYVLKRRFTKYTDCHGRFRYLRGKTGVQMTKKERVILPLLFE